jgi:hypothetical protein
MAFSPSCFLALGRSAVLPPASRPIGRPSVSYKDEILVVDSIGATSSLELTGSAGVLRDSRGVFTDAQNLAAIFS